MDPERQRLGVSTRPVAAEFKVGQEVKGKVRTSRPGTEASPLHESPEKTSLGHEICNCHPQVLSYGEVSYMSCLSLKGEQDHGVWPVCRHWSARKLRDLHSIGQWPCTLALPFKLCSSPWQTQIFPRSVDALAPTALLSKGTGEQLTRRGDCWWLEDVRRISTRLMKYTLALAQVLRGPGAPFLSCPLVFRLLPGPPVVWCPSRAWRGAG